jgi:hypothetical protein
MVTSQARNAVIALAAKARRHLLYLLLSLQMTQSSVTRRLAWNAVYIYVHF